ncbi:canalicular multispecific organic anion transporter 2, partial [Aplysia californica]|uniref:Canalicular multispecific organic anion transporter 2 n=1 Tax=Aplysia californica TaxID=6500 RepID=A0ABM1AC29_APLCA
MSVDTNHLEMFLNQAFFLWVSAALLGVAVVLLYTVVGLAMLPGLGFIGLSLGVNLLVTQKMKTYQYQMMKVKDARLRLMGEVLNGIKVIKLYGWEPLFTQKILDVRNTELKVLLKYAIVDAVDTFSYTASTFWITFLILMTYVLIEPDHHLDASQAFVTISYIGIIRMAINNLPILIRTLVKSATSISRINKFLHLEDIDPDSLDRDTTNELPVQVVGADFCWDSSEPPILKNVNLEVKPGQLVAVVGPVGAGKSSLLSAVLGEMHRARGYSNLNASVAFVPQQAWIQNSSIKTNIQFGQAFDSKFYERVLEACALKPDLAMLPAGDNTEIGEKGINLSGGQKQRVSVARAVYSQAQVYLLDDPLSAVDSHVGKHIFKHVIGHSGLLKGKTRILVTHGLHLLPRVDYIVVMHEGRVSEAGSYEELLSHNGAFSRFLVQHLAQGNADVTTTTEDDVSEDDAEDEPMRKDMLRRLRSLTSDGDVTAADDQPEPPAKMLAKLDSSKINRPKALSLSRRSRRKSGRTRRVSSMSRMEASPDEVIATTPPGGVG